MADSIDRQAAIDALDGEIEITGRTNAEAVKGYVRLVKDRLERLPSAQRWIPVTERLPEEKDSIYAKYYGTDRWEKSMFRKRSDTVLVTVEFSNGKRMTDTSHTTDGEWWITVSVVPQKVIAWKPLPEPYRAEKEEFD